jgi:hypothetical protein
MFSRWKIATFVLGLVLVGAAFAVTQPAPRVPDKVAVGEADVTQLLALMDTNKNGKVSKQEFMKFMEAEFDRLDKDKSGELDPKELLQMQRPLRSVVGK